VAREISAKSIRDVVGLVAVGFAGFLVSLLLLRFALNYDIVARYAAASAAHIDIKSWMPGLAQIVTFAFVDQVELACGMGVAAALVFYDQVASTAVDFTRKRTDAVGYLTAALVLVMLGLAVVGKVKAESARLWLFLVPVICLLVTQRIIRRFGPNPRAVLILILILQYASTLALKRFEDFYRPII
jgi:hypothetical protein